MRRPGPQAPREDDHLARGTTPNGTAKPGPHRAFVANCDEERERRLVLAARLSEALAGISCARLAERTGWSAETVRRYLQGKAAPPATLLMVLAEEVSVNPDYLLLGRGPVHLAPSMAEPRPVPNGQILDALYYLLAQQEGQRREGAPRPGERLPPSPSLKRPDAPRRPGLC